MARPVRLSCFSPQSIAYDAAWRWQRATAASVGAGEEIEAVALLQHPPTYTFGRRVRPEHLLLAAEELRCRGADVVESDRGGDVTFHGPGQLVVYPILNLRSRHLGPGDYVRRLEETIIEALAGLGVDAERVAGRPGVWVAGAKIAAIGVRLQGGVTTHGFALNVETDLSWFDAIVPCGISAAPVTSLARVLGSSPGTRAVEDAICDAFEDAFESQLVPAGSSQPRDLVLSHGC